MCEQYPGEQNDAEASRAMSESWKNLMHEIAPRRRSRSLPVVHDRSHVDVDTCTKCGGSCCKLMPGIYAPEDFGAPNDGTAPDRKLMVRRVRDALEDGLACVDREEGWFSSYGVSARSPLWIRPPMKGHEAWATHFTDGYGDQCSLLTPTGCSLAHDTRPFGCRDLEPDPKGNCTPTTTRAADIARWVLYQDVIELALVERSEAAE